jgi:hypothetical protein
MTTRLPARVMSGRCLRFTTPVSAIAETVPVSLDSSGMSHGRLQWLLMARVPLGRLRARIEPSRTFHPIY